MKNLKRFLMLFLCVCTLVLTIGMGRVVAADTVKEYDFSSKSNYRVEGWSQNGNTTTATDSRGPQINKTTVTITSPKHENIGEFSMQVAANGGGTVKAYVATKVDGSDKTQVGDTISVKNKYSQPTTFKLDDPFTGYVIIEAKAEKSLYIKYVTITTVEAPSKGDLAAVTNVVASFDEENYELSVTFDEVENATSYTAIVLDGETEKYTQEKYVSGQVINFNARGKYTVKIVAKASGYNSSYGVSNEVEMTTKDYSLVELEKLAIETKSTEFYQATGLVVRNGGSYYLVQDDNDVKCQLYNCKFKLEENVGKIVTVYGNIQLYKKGKTETFEIVDAILYNSVCGVDLAEQHTEVENGKVDIRLIGGLNVKYNGIKNLRFEIANTDDQTATLNIDSVFGSLTAKGKDGKLNGKTAKEMGYKSLFAVTVTNIPVDTMFTFRAIFEDKKGNIVVSEDKIISVDSDGTVSIA